MDSFDIITLENKKEYCIIKMLEYDYDTYLLLNEIDKDENLLSEIVIAKILSENEIVLVTDKDEFDNIRDLFVSLLINKEGE